MMKLMKLYDVYLSHHESDFQAVELIGQRLRTAGLNPFLEKWHLVPGQPWQEQLEAAIAKSRTFAAFLGPADFGPWENEKTRVALERRVHDPSFGVIPVLLPGAELPERGRLPSFLNRLPWVDFRQSLDDDERFRCLVAGIKGLPRENSPRPEEPGVRCPYRGLEAFDEKHAEFFFGREELVQRLVENLRYRNFLALIGPSGSGKSSTVRAGLLPELARDSLLGSHRWARVLLTPGPRPLEELATQLTGALPREGAALSTMMELKETLCQRPEALHSAIHLSLELSQDGPESVLLIVDQFEELFTVCTSEKERARFVANLLYASGIPRSRTKLIVVLRADFYARAAMYPELADRISSYQILVTPMVEAELPGSWNP